VPETDRLLLRRWTAADLEPFAAMNADPTVMEFFVAPLSRSDSDALVERIEAQFDELGYGLWAVETKSDGRFIGFVGLALQTFPAHFTPAVEVGWRLAQPAWNHGYASEAACRALDIGFDDAGLAEIVSTTSVPNVRSQRVMQRLGMTRDPADDFDHPNVPEGHEIRRHQLYRMRPEQRP
jgi:ribosomal-protein-alanine N-acetyltransferase